jgi:NitT/TauT family transport system ATP-binding protein
MMGRTAAKAAEVSPAPLSGAPAKLEVEEVSMVFPGKTGAITALDHVSMRVEEAEFVCIIGSSGCGKSTLLNVIGGLLRPTSGRIRVEGRTIMGPGADRGMVFQSYSLYPWLNVAENVGFGLKLRHASRRAIAERVDYYLDVVGLSDRRNASPDQLSGGMRQRVAIARALANEPGIILLDEPFGALDAQTKTRMHEFLLDVWRRTATTMLMITHDIEEAIFLAGRIYIMQGPPGRFIRELPIELPSERHNDIRFDPKFSDYRRQIYDSLNH